MVEENRKEVIGVDLGGTGIKAGRIKSDVIVAVVNNPTPVTNNSDDVVTKIIDTINEIISPTVEAIGIGIPSVVDVKKGIVYDVANIPSWKKVHLKDILENEFGIPVHLNNDANCFAIGEKIYGVGKDYHHFVGITLGTGLGAGIIQNDRLLKDVNCGSGEFCVIPYLDSDYEQYCSGMFFKQKGVDGKELFHKASEGDMDALKVFNEFGLHLAQLIKLVVATIDPEMIVLGGSVAHSYPYFNEYMISGMNDFAYLNSIKNLKIKVSEMENSAIFGAAALCF